MEGKKLLVFSDTHGNVNSLKTVFSWANNFLPPNDSICAAAFLGDGISDLKPAANATGFFCDWEVVKGNNDFGFSAPEAVVMEFAGSRFFLCHGHRHGLYGGLHSLAAAARNVDANAVLYGHAHVPSLKTIDGILLINPGSVGRPRSKAGATFAVIECKEGEPLKVIFYGIEQGKVRELKFN